MAERQQQPPTEEDELEALLEEEMAQADAEEAEMAYVPSALLRDDGSRPHNDEIRDVANDGRCFDDVDAPWSEQHYYSAFKSTHHGFEAFDSNTYLNPDGTVDPRAKEMYEYAKECEARQAAERARAAPLSLGIGLRSDGSRVDTAAVAAADGASFAEDQGPDPQPSHDDRVERGQTGMDLGFLRTPVCQTRGASLDHVKCFQCQERPAWDMQTLSEVFHTCWRRFDTGHEEAAVHCVVQMAQMLKSAQDAQVVARCCVCNSVDCLLRAGLMDPEWRIEWLNGPRRPQDERETARKDQVPLLESNIRIMHSLVQGGVLALEDVQHLMRFVAMNSQFVQEREKKFIATAMAVAENEHLFGYRFPDPQRFVNRMANFIHGYMIHVVVPHIMDCSTTPTQWNAHLQKLLDTALPKAPDAIYALMVEANAEQGNFEREPAAPLPADFDRARQKLPFGEHVQKHGRFVHRVGYGNTTMVKMFVPEHFFERLKKCVDASPHYELDYASSTKRMHANAGNVYEALRVANTEKGVVKIKRFEIQVAMRALNGTYGKRITTPANGVAELPTSGDLQLETNVHPRLRYHNLWLAFGCDAIESEDRVAMMLEYHPPRNEVGRELLRTGVATKACYALRTPTVGIPLLCDPLRPPTVMAAKRLDVLTSLAPASYVKLGSQRRQSRLAMGQHVSERRSGGGEAVVVLTREVKANGEISLLGAPSRQEEHKGVAAQTYELARDMQSARTMNDSARNVARVLDLHYNNRRLRGLPLIPLTPSRRIARLEAETGVTLDVPIPPESDYQARQGWIEDRTWDIFWAAWCDRRPSVAVTEAVRKLVRSLHEANAHLNGFAARFPSGEDALESEQYRVEDPGLHDSPEVLYEVCSVINRAATGASSLETHELVQDLLSSYRVIRTYAVLFMNAYEAGHPEKQGNTFAGIENSKGAAGRATWLANKATHVDVPVAVTRANVRDTPAFADEPSVRSECVVEAFMTAKENADELWEEFEPRIGDAITREEFETIGAQRAWAIERARRAQYEERFNKSTFYIEEIEEEESETSRAARLKAAKQAFCKAYNLEYDAAFEDPEVQARKDFAKTLRHLADVACDRRKEQLALNEKGLDVAHKRHADAMRREDERQRRTMGLDNNQAHRGRRRSRTRPAHIPEPPASDADEKIARARTNATKKRKRTIALIDKFADGAVAQDLEDNKDQTDLQEMEDKFGEAMRLRYGGMCQFYVHARYGKVSMDDKWALARKAKAATLANIGDDGEDGVNARNARADAEAALNRGAIDAELEDGGDDTDAANEALQAQAAAEAAAKGKSAEVNAVMDVDDESLGMALDGTRLQQQRFDHNAAVVTREELEEKFDDEVSHPAVRGNPLAGRRR